MNDLRMVSDTKTKPLVSVLCTTYNQGAYVEEALRSVLAQTYQHVELIVIDNASKDHTVKVIKRILREYPDVKFIANNHNCGLCRAFNQGLELAKGKYIIDLSGDDVLLPQRIERQVEVFERLPDTYGVVFSNARYIDTQSQPLNEHYPLDEHGRAKVPVPSGDVYKEILRKYFICTPTMMIRRAVLDELGGYDESLSYEDFDFWVRSAVRYRYHYQDEILTHKRVVDGSLSMEVAKPGSGILESTYAVCNKAYDLNRDQEEFDILAARIRTFIRKCLYAQEFELAVRFRKLLNYIEDPGLLTETIVLLCRLRLPLNGLYRFYLAHIQKKPLRRKDLVYDVVLP